MMRTAEHAFWYAVYEQDLPRIKALIASGVDVNSRLYNRTALQYASESGYLSSVVALIEAGADVNARDTGGGTTALHLAAMRGRRKIATALIAAGADVNALNTNLGTPPALTACRSGRRSMLKLLLRAGAATTFEPRRVFPYASGEAAFALLDSVVDAGGWDEFVLRHRAIIKAIVSKCAPLPDDCLLTIAAFICPPGGW